MNNNPDKPSSDISDFIVAIRSHFRPAENPEEATHRYSTAEIREAIVELNPGLSITDADVFVAMREAGFTFDTVPGAQSLMFKWLLINMPHAASR